MGVGAGVGEERCARLGVARGSRAEGLRCCTLLAAGGWLVWRGYGQRMPWVDWRAGLEGDVRCTLYSSVGRRQLQWQARRALVETRRSVGGVARAAEWVPYRCARVGADSPTTHHPACLDCTLALTCESVVTCSVRSSPDRVERAVQATPTRSIAVAHSVDRRCTLYHQPQCTSPSPGFSPSSGGSATLSASSSTTSSPSFSTYCTCCIARLRSSCNQSSTWGDSYSQSSLSHFAYWQGLR